MGSVGHYGVNVLLSNDRCAGLRGSPGGRGRRAVLCSIRRRTVPVAGRGSVRIAVGRTLGGAAWYRVRHNPIRRSRIHHRNLHQNRIDGKARDATCQYRNAEKSHNDLHKGHSDSNVAPLNWEHDSTGTLR